jgi:signal peptidase I
MTSATTSPARRPRLALLAGLLLPGLGQVYCGEIARGALYLLGFALLLPSAAWLGVHGPRVLLCPMVVAAALATIAIYLGGAVAAYRSVAAAHRLGRDITPGPWQRPIVYLALFLVGHFFVLAPLASHVRNDLLESFKVPSASMMPTILPGDRFFADKRVGRPGEVKLRRGDIAVFRYPNDRTTLYVKRVVGLPGDRIAIEGTSVKVNGVELRQEELYELGGPSLNHLLAEHQAFRETTDGRSYTVLWRKAGERPSLSLTVPNGQVFVLGDNRDAAKDSRHFGALPLADVTALARQVWFSIDTRDGWRAGRTGKVLE